LEVPVFGLRRRNPTAGWVARPGGGIDLDLDAFTLGGAAVGDPAEFLSLLGPGEPGTLAKEYHFPARGVTLDLAGDVLAAVHVHPPAFRGTVRFRGSPVPVESLTGPEACARLFGEPDVIEDGILTYIPDGNEWELLLGDDRVVTISLY
jgi:hypothetical protein